MKMVIGGASQGKLAFAQKEYPGIRWIDGRQCEEGEVYECQGICYFHAYIRRLMQEGRDVSELAGKLIRRNPDVVIVSDEIGYGIVPVDDFLRHYREVTGRICTELAAYAECVHRVVCGIGVRIK